MNWCTLWLVSLFFACYSITCTVIGVSFMAGTLTCDVEALLSKGCAERVGLLSTRGTKRECFTRCAQNASCVGVSLDIKDESYCVLHQDCYRKVGCPQTLGDPNRRFYSRNCAHGGRWKPGTDKCLCVKGWSGPSCQDLPNDYTDMKAAGYGMDYTGTYLDLRSRGFGIVLISITTSQTNNYHNIGLMLHSGGMSFNRSWAEYQYGFFHNDNNMWSGLHSWWALSQLGYNKLTTVIAFKNGARAYRKYKRVQISNASRGFAILSLGDSTSSWTGPQRHYIPGAEFGDCLGPYVNVSFSTYDLDADGVPEINCARLVRSGWWYNDSCSSDCNLLGRGPKHWKHTGTARRLRILGLDSRHITQENFDEVYFYLRK